jgi:putative hydrolase of the HAD superfamily
MKLEAVTFDVTHTLLSCPGLGQQYADVLARHGIAVAPGEIEAAIPLVWQELACSASPARDRFLHHPKGARGFWRHFVERTCELIDAPRPSAFAAAELFDRFARPEAWEVAPGTHQMLADLKRRGLKLAVISNWDQRLPVLLERLDLALPFDSFAISAIVGVEKPHPRIFETALAALGVAAERALHVGDSLRDDVEGAQGVGMRALRLSPSGDGDLVRLADLPELLFGERRLAL